MAGLRFLFVDLVKEIETFTNLAEDFLDPGTTWTLCRLKDNLEKVSEAAENRVFRLKLQSLRTNPSEGEYEICDRKGRREVYATVSGIWELRPLGRKSKKRMAEFCGIASTKIELFASDEPSKRLAMWRLELGTHNSPGCYFHAQILGDVEDPPFPKSVPIPRLPSVFITPMSALEFVLGELFQNRWAKATAANTRDPQLPHRDRRATSAHRKRAGQGQRRDGRGTLRRRLSSACNRPCGDNAGPFAPFRLRSMSMPPCPESLGRLATPALAPSPLDTSPQGALPF